MINLIILGSRCNKFSNRTLFLVFPKGFFFPTFFQQAWYSWLVNSLSLILLSISWSELLLFISFFLAFIESMMFYLISHLHLSTLAIFSFLKIPFWRFSRYTGEWWILSFDLGVFCVFIYVSKMPLYFYHGSFWNEISSYKICPKWGRWEDCFMESSFSLRPTAARAWLTSAFEQTSHVTCWQLAFETDYWDSRYYLKM